MKFQLKLNFHQLKPSEYKKAILSISSFENKLMKLGFRISSFRPNMSCQILPRVSNIIDVKTNNRYFPIFLMLIIPYDKLTSYSKYYYHTLPEILAFIIAELNKEKIKLMRKGMERKRTIDLVESI